MRTHSEPRGTSVEETLVFASNKLRDLWVWDVFVDGWTMQVMAPEGASQDEIIAFARVQIARKKALDLLET